LKLLSLLLLLGLDIVSKIEAISAIPPMGWGSYPFGGIGIFSDFLGTSFSLNFVVNTGVAFGLFPDHPNLLFAMRIAIILGLIIFRKKIGGGFPLYLILTGAIGNAIDYLLYGHVIDFLHFTFFGHSFPVFNFADSYITIGIASLFLLQSFKKTPQPI
jgi:signal peptidase II